MQPVWKKNKFDLEPELKKSFKKAILSTKYNSSRDNDLFISDDTGTNYLPKPISDEIIETVYEENVARQLFESKVVVGRTRSVSVTTDDDNVKQVPVGSGAKTVVDAESKEQKYTTGSIVLNVGKLCARAKVPYDDIEQAEANDNIDIVDQVLSSITNGMTKAEEKAILSDSAENRSSNTSSDVVKGLFKWAQDAQKNTNTVSLDASTTRGVSNGISKAKMELHEYGKGAPLVLLCSDKFAHQLRIDEIINESVSGSGINLINGQMPTIFGVNVLASSYIDDIDPDKAIVIPVSEPIIGYSNNIRLYRDRNSDEDCLEFNAYYKFDLKLRHLSSSLADALVRLDITAS